MHKLLIAVLGVALVPAVAHAQGVQSYLTAIMQFISSTLLPLLFGLAFLFFLVNIVRYFIIGASDMAAQESARRLALWGIIAFVLMLSLWGIVNFLVFGLGFARTVPPCPDYLPASACRTGSDEYVEPDIIPQIEDEDPFPADATEEPQFPEPEDPFPADATEEPQFPDDDAFAEPLIGT